MSIFVKIDGIKGHSTAKGYEDWFEASTFNFSVNRHVVTKPGSIVDRESGKPSIGEFQLAKPMDKSSPYLFLESCAGKARDSAIIHWCHSSDEMNNYLQFSLSHVLISHYFIEATNKEQNAMPVERIHLNFSKIEMKYIPYDEKHTAQSPILVGYNLETASKL